MSLKIERLANEELERRGVFRWPQWTKEISEFPWEYDTDEECYLLEGRVAVFTEQGVFEFGAGDFVTFEKGLSCNWKVISPVRKHYRFK